MLFCIEILFYNSLQIVVHNNLTALKAYVAALLVAAAANQELKVVVVAPLARKEVVASSCKGKQNAIICLRLCLNADKSHFFSGFRSTEQNSYRVVTVGGGEDLFAGIILHLAKNFVKSLFNSKCNSGTGCKGCSACGNTECEFFIYNDFFHNKPPKMVYITIIAQKNRFVNRLNKFF